MNGDSKSGCQWIEYDAPRDGVALPQSLPPPQMEKKTSGFEHCFKQLSLKLVLFTPHFINLLAEWYLFHVFGILSLSLGGSSQFDVSRIPGQH